MAACRFCGEDLQGATPAACPYCGETLGAAAPCPACGLPIPAGSSTCLACRSPLPAPGAVPVGAAPVAPPAGLVYVAWEDRSVPWLRRLWATVKASMFEPIPFFRRLPRDTGVGGAITYTLLLQTINAVATLLTCTLPMIVLLYVVLRTAPSGRPGGGMGQLHLQMAFQTGAAVLGPVLSIAWLYVISGLVHVTGRALGVPGDFQRTFRGVAYSMGPVLFQWIPFVGAAAGIYVIVLQVFAMKEMHGIGGGKAAAMVLLPVGALMLLCCGGFFAIGFGAAILAHA